MNEQGPEYHVADFVFSKSTKGAIQFKEVEQPGKPMQMQTLYLRKDCLKGQTTPKTVRVTVEVFY